MPAPDVAILEVDYRYRTSDAAGLEVQYQYTAADPQISLLDVTYQYTNEISLRCPALQGANWSDHTQRVANRLPSWHKGRIGEHQTNYQKLINTFGQEVENIFHEMAQARRNFYVDTADVFQLYESYRSDLQFSLGDRQKQPSRNLLRNSDFAINGIARYKLPYAWSDLKSMTTGTVSNQDIIDSVTGGTAVTMRASAGERAYLRQQQLLLLEGAESLTLSAWVNIPVAQAVANDETENEFIAALYLSVVYVDGESAHIRQALPVTTLGMWNRVSTTLTLSKPTSVITAMVALEVPDSARDYVIMVDALQLEEGTVPTQWHDNTADGPEWLDIQDDNPNGPLNVHILETSGTESVTIDSETVNVTTNPKRRLYFTEDMFEFGHRAIPTSVASLTDIDADEVPNTFGTKKYGLWTSSNDKSSFPVLWRVNPDDDTQIQRYLEGPGDVLDTYDLADRDLDQGFGNQFGVPADQYESQPGYYILNIRDMTISKRYIWAFCREIITGKDPIYSIKVISTDNFRASTYLEVLYDFTFSDSDNSALVITELAGQYSFLAHVNGRPDQLILGSDNLDYFRIDLNFDYYILAEDRGQLVTRHQYAGNLVMT